MNLESYLDYRLDDVGKEYADEPSLALTDCTVFTSDSQIANDQCLLLRFLSAKICFPRGIHLTEEFALVDAVDKNAARHISVINDIWSYDKEMKAVRLGKEGSTMTNAVDVLADEASMPIESTKRVLYRICREWEIVHDTLVAEIFEKRESPALRIYLKDNEYQMSGNEGWSKVAFRYSVAP
ncbi:hypothetical protein NUW58_g4970 [Xylaria curta]|uniref:Uncharacterized protein n=1 Tax=Xylaria curta TaxID=42375 RepID=A0ACC1P5K4_9PEZI|nr:hypothetical protein NUW58_g4970 [Xylaria curta]